MPTIRAIDVQPVGVYKRDRLGYGGSPQEDRFVRVGRHLSLLTAEWLQVHDVTGSRANYGLHYLSPEMGERVGQSQPGVMREGVRRSWRLVNVVVPDDFHNWPVERQRQLLLDSHVDALDVLGDLDVATRADLRNFLHAAGPEHLWVSPAKMSRGRTLEARFRFRTDLAGVPEVTVEYRRPPGQEWDQVELDGLFVPTLEAFQKYGRAMRLTDDEISVDTSKGTVFLPNVGVITVRLES